MRFNFATAIKHEAQIMVTNDEQWRLVSEVVIFVLKDFTGDR